MDGTGFSILLADHVGSEKRDRFVSSGEPTNRRDKRSPSGISSQRNSEDYDELSADLILQFAHWIGEHERERTAQEVSVYADVMVSLNGRKSQVLIDPERDLMKVSDSLLNQEWVFSGDEE